MLLRRTKYQDNVGVLDETKDLRGYESGGGGGEQYCRRMSERGSMRDQTCAANQLL